MDTMERELKKLVRISYSKEEDAYDLETSIDDGETWKLRTEYPCRETNKNYIHFSIIPELNAIAACGYKYYPFPMN